MKNKKKRIWGRVQNREKRRGAMQTPNGKAKGVRRE